MGALAARLTLMDSAISPMGTMCGSLLLRMMRRPLVASRTCVSLNASMYRKPCMNRH